MQAGKTPALRLAATVFLIGAATFIVHEASHWLVGTLLGYPLRISPNRVALLVPMQQVHHLWMTAAGPLATCLQAVLGYGLVARRASLAGFAMVYMAFFMRLVAMGVSMFNPNDEARLSQDLGLGTWTLPVVVVGGLLLLLVAASRRMGFGLRQQLLCYVVASVVVGLFVGGDMFWFGKG